MKDGCWEEILRRTRRVEEKRGVRKREQQRARDAEKGRVFCLRALFFALFAGLARQTGAGMKRQTCLRVLSS